jgi:quercetin dioxygenase-like cupin family protein
LRGIQWRGCKRMNTTDNHIGKHQPSFEGELIIKLPALSLTWVNSRARRPCDIYHMNERPLIDVAQEKILSLADETKFAANGIVSRTLLRTENSRVVLFGFAEGQELTEHTSTQTAVVQILSGECEFSLDGKSQVAKAGDLIYMPPNLPHAVRATQQFSMLLTLSKTETLSAKP